MAKTNQEKLDDIWWILCSDSGRDFLAELVGGRAASKTLNTAVKRGGAMKGDTSLGAMVAWNDDHVVSTIAAVAAQAATGGADIAQIKQAVTDAVAAGINVDVTVTGGK